MSIVDHVALEVADLESSVQRLAQVHGLELIRWGTRYSTGLPIAMMADANGFKVEVIQAGDEQPDTSLERPRMDHMAFRVDDVQHAEDALAAQDSTVLKPCHRLEAAKADSALLQDPNGLKVQMVRYDEDSPDAVHQPPQPGSARAG